MRADRSLDVFAVRGASVGVGRRVDARGDGDRGSRRANGLMQVLGVLDGFFATLRGLGGGSGLGWASGPRDDLLNDVAVEVVDGVGRAFDETGRAATILAVLAHLGASSYTKPEDLAAVRIEQEVA